MIKNYFLIAWRQIAKNKIYAAINILGLVVGLSVYVFGTMLVDYEESHDMFYEKSDRIFIAGTLFSATANIGVGETDGIYSAYAPIILAEIEEVEEVARTIKAEFLVSIEDDHYYQNIRFADPSLLKIFDFDYIEGDGRALDDPSGLLISKSTATKFFGASPALGKVLILDHDVSLHVTAVVADLPPNTHFNSSIIEMMGARFEAVAPLAALNRASEYDLSGNWNNLSMGDMTYMLLPGDKTRDWLQAKMDGLFEAHYPDASREFITGLKVRPLVEANIVIFDAVGLPIMNSIRILAFMVLLVAIANYTNLATAQSMGRSREIGLRKTMGATRWQLVVQFMVESLCITAISMLIALAVLEALVPVYNGATGRGLVMNYGTTLPWLFLTTIGVGLVAGAYPAYLITRASPIDALAGSKGVKGSRFRSMMLGLQFAISIFMLAMVLVVYLQNMKIEGSSNIYPKSQIVTLQRVGVESIQASHETLRNELMALANIENVSFASQLPYEQSTSSFGAGPVQGDESSAFLMSQVFIDEHFLDTYNIPLLRGRGFSTEVAQDTLVSGVPAVNVIINELGTVKLGFASPGEAVNQVFYDFPDEREPRAYTIIGVWPDQNYQGFHNKIKPMVFMMRPSYLDVASIRVQGSAMGKALTDIESVWKRVIPDYPIQTEFLDDTFGQIFQIYGIMTILLGGFAFVALSLSMIGLFGLSAFMAESRTKEIGIRKVMGASMPQIVNLLIFQFSKPAMWALLVAMPLAYVAAGQYLNFFAERISTTAGIVVGAGVLAVAFAWAIVAVHAIKIARANPIRALRYE